MASRKRQDENLVVYAVRQVCGLYGVSVFREQSRMFKVTGAAGRERPMFIGQWEDALAKPHYAGKADLLARPRVRAGMLFRAGVTFDFEHAHERETITRALTEKITVPLWIETKAKGGKLSAEQEAFRHFVQGNAEFHIVVAEDVRPLIEWFEKMGVKRA